MEDTRSRLLKASRQAFAELGYVATRVDDIVQRAGLSHGTFYRYFKDKEDVLYGVTQDIARALYGAAVAPLGRAPSGPRDAVRQRLTAFFAAYAEEWDVAKVWMQAEGVHPTIQEVRTRVRSSIVNGVADLIERDREHGLLLADVNGQVAAGAFVAMVEGFANLWLAAGEPVSELVVDQLADYWSRAIYRSAPPANPE